MLNTLFVILNLFILESLLSVDNAAVLAVMVKDLPPNQQKKALRYGLFGAYFFRGLCLFLASWLVKILWLKIAGGLYLAYLTYNYFSTKNDEKLENQEHKESNIIKYARKIGLSPLWATIVLVEFVDLTFSIDNVFAAVALSNNFYTIMAGVAIGILAMRFVSGWFVNLLEKFPSLEKSAFIVIGLLGFKLILSGVLEYYPEFSKLKEFTSTHTFDFYFSGLMMLIFFAPIVSIKIKKARKSH